MDINPDQMITSGRLAATSLIARCFDAMNRFTLRSARRVIVLDRFMRDRILAKRAISDKIAAIGPWGHEDRLEPLPHHENPFRERHGLNGKIVVMYSGNHGFSTPVATLLKAAERLMSMRELTFVFIGGGVLKKDVDDFVSRVRPPNVLSLPYQPIEAIRYSLAAADVHVVSIANEAVGVVHSCKIYGAMAVGRPVLSLGPPASHANDIVVRERIGWSCEQGDVEGLVATLQSISRTPREEFEEMGSRAKQAVQDRYSRQKALDAVCDLIELPVESVGMERVA
jgi:glycosyltransferase involved in cell wall biosynthesis